MRWICFGLAGVVSFGAAACGGTTERASRTVTTTETRAPEQRKAKKPTFVELIRRVKSGVVRIETAACTEQATGTGFLIAPRWVATVEHVVDGARQIVLKQGGRQVATARVVGFDRTRDLALLRTSQAIGGYRFTLSDHAPELGESVAALGFPLGLPLTVTRGSVSGLNRTIPIEGIRRRRLVQTDAAVNRGNSGGPLLSADSGQVVGLVDLGTTEANGLAFAVSSEVARTLIRAWQLAPQPVSQPACGGRPPSGRALTSTYVGHFTSVDRLERCYANNEYVECSAGPSQKAVRLDVGQGVEYLGVRGSADRGGPAMAEGTSFQTPAATIECGSSSRGIACTDLTTGASFVIGDYRVTVDNGTTSIPSTHAGHFTSVDRLERCYATDEYVECSAGPSQKAVRLDVGQGVQYLGVKGSVDRGGPAMPEGTSFQTPAETIECGSSSRGITCIDLTTGAGFVIGDYKVVVDNP